jgi:hypothetical protein
MSDAFRVRSIRYAIMGGIAAQLRSRPRFTRDVDVILDVPQLALPNLLEDLAGLGFSFDSATVIREYVQDSITVIHFQSVRIDWLKPVLPLYARALADATSLPWTEGHDVKVATAEGVILTKMVAFRPQDQHDIETLLAANREDINLELIRREWSAIADEEEARTAWLEDAIRRLVPIRD